MRDAILWRSKGGGWRGRLLLPNTNGDNRVRVDIPCHLIHAVKEGTVSNIQQLIKKKKKKWQCTTKSQDPYYNCYDV